MRIAPAMCRLLPNFAFLLLTVALSRAADAPVPATPPPSADTPPVAIAPAAAATPEAPTTMPTPPYLSPEDAAKTFKLPPGYHLELVLSEPVIREPVVSVFDGNGRLYIAEMRSYMQTADSSNDGDEKQPISRVSLHWSSKGDGKLDQHTVFADNLVLPRMILPLKDSVLIQETFTGEVYEYRDTNGDGVSDEKKLFHTFPRAGDNNLEHQPSGLIWAMDNWIYSTYSSVRIRWTPKGAVSEPTAANGGQWGISQDNYGKTWVHNAGSNSGPRNFQTPIVYGAFQTANQEAPGYKEVFPLIGLGDVQPGAQYLRPDGTLNATTSAAGVDIYRGDRLPADLVGDLLYGEPVGRLIRRTKIDVKEGITSISNPYQTEKSDFIRSTDAYFRPVNMVTAPDGTIYITDMYRGIIQEGNWTKPGSFLRRAIDKYGIGEKVGRGRVWRLVYDGMKPGPEPKMLDETPAQLVAHLSHPNGWWRDTAQKLLILTQDKSVVPALQSLARTSSNPLARIHALWTLEGLSALDAAFVREKLKDSDPQVRVAAIRASETLYKAGDTSLKDDILGLSKSPDASVGIQAMLTANYLKLPEATAMISKTALSNPLAGVKQIAIQLINPIGGTIGAQFSGPQRQQLERGQATYLQLCFACHGLDGKGTPIEGRTGTLAPPLAGSATATGHRDGLILTLLHGLSGPVNGTTYEGLMIPMGTNDDAWIADVASYVRTSFGNQSPLISPQDVARLRAAYSDRKEPWTIASLNAQLPQPVGNRAAWKFTTNRPEGATANAETPSATSLSFTAAAPVAGAWLQIELPEPVTLSELRLNSTKAPRNYARGYRIELSADGETWTEAVSNGAGTGPIIDASFAPAKAKWVRITHTQTQFGRGGRGGGGRGGPPANAGAPAAAPADAAASATAASVAIPTPATAGATAPVAAGTPAAPAAAAPAPAFGGRGQAPTDWTLNDVQLFQPGPTVVAKTLP
ncbi:MAG: discoidin domain-containing protein [Opitutaceae bacterium]